ncbi:hypothetical protein AAFC00_004540 [Neodothiora populina]
MLEDIAILQEASAGLQCPPLSVERTNAEGQPKCNAMFEHCLWRVTLKDKQHLSYALDLSGAQYGWYDPLISWEELLRDRCDTSHLVLNASGLENYEMHIDWARTRRRADYTWTYDIANGFEALMTTQFRVWDSGATEMLELPEMEFQQKRRAFLDMVRQFIEAAVMSANTMYVREQGLEVPQAGG